MVAVKASQANSFLKSLDRSIRAVLFYGPDAGLVSERGERLAKHWAGLDKPPGEILRFDDESLADDPDRLIVELGTMPMFGGRKAVRATAGRRIDGKSLGGVLAGGLPDAFLVVEAGNLLPSSELRQVFEKAAHAAAVACYPDDAQAVAGVIDDVVRSAGMGIEPDARAALMHRLGADRALTRNEIEKLVLFAHGRDRIVQDDVEQIVGDAAELALEQIVNAAASGQVERSLQDAARAWAAGESAQSLIASLQRHLMRLHKARVALDNGVSLDTILRQQRPPLNIKLQPIFSAQCRSWGLPALTTALRLAAETALKARLESGLEEALAERLLLNVAFLAGGGKRAAASGSGRR